jgi:hypothetical protein
MIETTKPKVPATDQGRSNGETAEATRPRSYAGEDDEPECEDDRI